MDWRLKAAAQSACAVLPRAAGDRAYHLLQARNGLVPQVAGHLQFLERVREHVDVAGASVVELGSGWYPMTPLLLLTMGAATVDTFDLHHHYSDPRTTAAAQALLEAGFDDAVLHDVARTGTLPTAIRYHPSVDIGRAAIEPADVGLSRFVLEHVRPDAIETIHERSRRWLTGSWVHWVSPGDHRSHSDRRLSNVDFLRYGERSWRMIGGNRFAYHNRLRRPEYRERFLAAGWEITVDEAVVDPDLERSVSTSRVAERFSRFSPADLVAGSLWFVLTPRA